MLRARSFPFILALAVVAGAAAVPSPPAGGGEEISDLEARVEAARDAATAAAAEYEEAWSAWAALDNEIFELEASIDAAVTQSIGLQVAAERRAVNAYMGHDQGLNLYLEEDGSVLDAARRATLLDRVNAADEAAVDQLGVIEDDLTARRDEVARKKEEQAAALEELKAEEGRLTAELEASQAALAEAQEAQRRAEEQAARQREQQQEQAPAPTDTSDPAPSSSGAPVGGIVCPVPASSFVDSWGAPRGGGLYHWGIDMMAPAGSKNYAVVSGNVEHHYGSTSGNGVYLRGDNGTLYYYFHLQSYEGSSRHVSQGELIGYTGNTGASWAAPHTHFEMHPGGGESVNPYPSLKAACG
jgi:murein DD-endopeptidase MepM/ murein hydrolase activator NlpD